MDHKNGPPQIPLPVLNSSNSNTSGIFPERSVSDHSSRKHVVFVYVGENSSLHERIARRFSPHLLYEFAMRSARVRTALWKDVSPLNSWSRIPSVPQCYVVWITLASHLLKVPAGVDQTTYPKKFVLIRVEPNHPFCHRVPFHQHR